MPNVYIYINNTLYTSLYNICIFYNSNTFGTVLRQAHQSIIGEINVGVESLWFSRSDNLQMVDFSRRCKRLSTLPLGIQKQKQKHPNNMIVLSQNTKDSLYHFYINVFYSHLQQSNIVYGFSPLFNQSTKKTSFKRGRFRPPAKSAPAPT